MGRRRGEAGVRFVRDPREAGGAAPLRAVEEAAVEWFALPEEDKDAQGGAYGRRPEAGGGPAFKFREQARGAPDLGTIAALRADAARARVLHEAALERGRAALQRAEEDGRRRQEQLDRRAQESSSWDALHRATQQQLHDAELRAHTLCQRCKAAEGATKGCACAPSKRRGVAPRSGSARRPRGRHRAQSEEARVAAGRESPSSPSA